MPQDQGWKINKWFMTYDEERRQFDIRFENSQYRNYLASCQDKEVVKFIIDQHNKSLEIISINIEGRSDLDLSRYQL